MPRALARAVDADLLVNWLQQAAVSASTATGPSPLLEAMRHSLGCTAMLVLLSRPTGTLDWADWADDESFFSTRFDNRPIAQRALGRRPPFDLSGAAAIAPAAIDGTAQVSALVQNHLRPHAGIRIKTVALPPSGPPRAYFVVLYRGPVAPALQEAAQMWWACRGGQPRSGCAREKSAARVAAWSEMASGFVRKLGELGQVQRTALHLLAQFYPELESSPLLATLRRALDDHEGWATRLCQRFRRPSGEGVRPLRLDLLLRSALERLKRGGTPVKLARRPIPGGGNAAGVFVLGHREPLVGCLMELFQNALAFSGGTGAEMAWEIGAAEVILHLWNRSSSCSPVVVARALELFFSTSPVAGKGLGLTLAQATIAEYGGDLRFECADDWVHVQLQLPRWKWASRRGTAPGTRKMGTDRPVRPAER